MGFLLPCNMKINYKQCIGNKSKEKLTKLIHIFFPCWGVVAASKLSGNMILKKKLFDIEFELCKSKIKRINMDISNIYMFWKLLKMICQICCGVACISELLSNSHLDQQLLFFTQIFHLMSDWCDSTWKLK